MLRRIVTCGGLALLVCATPVGARDSLGVFGEWGAFRDPQVPRCYAIAAAQVSRLARDFDPYASVGTWPGREVRGQLHMRLSRAKHADSRVTLTVGRRSFTMSASGSNAWAADRAMDAEILAAMRSSAAMTVTTRDTLGRRFTDRYGLEGVATALDAATVGCARRE